MCTPEGNTVSVWVHFILHLTKGSSLRFFFIKEYKKIPIILIHRGPTRCSQQLLGFHHWKIFTPCCDRKVLLKMFSLCVGSVTGPIYGTAIASQNRLYGNRTHHSTADAFAIQTHKIYTSEFQFIGFNPEIHRYTNCPLLPLYGELQL